MKDEAKARELARQIIELADKGAEVGSGEHAAAQSQLAAMGYELAELVLANG